MVRVPTCFLLLPKCVSSGGSGSLASASPLIKGESQKYSRTFFRKLCSRYEQYWLLSLSSGSFNMRIINYQVCSHTGYMPSSKHFSSHTACNTPNPYCVQPPLSFYFNLCGPFKKYLLNLLQYFFFFMFWVLGCEACGILASWPGTEPLSPVLEGKVLTSGPSWKPILPPF